MNKLKSAWNFILETKSYIDATLIIIGLIALFFLLQLTLIKVVVYLLGCWQVGGYICNLSLWASNKFK